MRPFRVAVLASGRGSNFEALLGAAPDNVALVGLVTDRADAKALLVAAQNGLPSQVVRRAEHTDAVTWERALLEAVEAHSPDLVVLAGFMRILRGPLLRGYARRIINIHPSLLPSFPGLEAQAQALRAGVRVAGCTVHVVDQGVDSGPILGQAVVPVRTGDDDASLSARILRAEHALLPEVVALLAEGWRCRPEAMDAVAWIEAGRDEGRRAADDGSSSARSWDAWISLG